MKYTVEIYGYGAEVSIGNPSEEEIQLLINDEDESLSSIVFDKFEERSWYDIDNQLHHCGCSSENATITIRDEKGNEIAEFSSDNSFELKSETISVEEDLELFNWEYTDIDESKPLMMSVSSEKGRFFEGQFETDNFDITKFKINGVDEIGLSDFYWGDMITSVSYDGEEIENYGGDTDGKSFDVYINFDKSTIRDSKIDQIL
jgi:hypothetical protein